MTAAHVGNRHAGLGRLRQDRQLLIQRPASTALDLREDFDSINTARHSRITRRTPSSWLCSYVRLKWGPLHRLTWTARLHASRRYEVFPAAVAKAGFRTPSADLLPRSVVLLTACATRRCLGLFFDLGSKSPVPHGAHEQTIVPLVLVGIIDCKLGDRVVHEPGRTEVAGVTDESPGLIRRECNLGHN